MVCGVAAVAVVLHFTSASSGGERRAQSTTTTNQIVTTTAVDASEPQSAGAATDDAARTPGDPSRTPSNDGAATVRAQAAPNSTDAPSPSASPSPSPSPSPDVSVPAPDTIATLTALIYPGTVKLSGSVRDSAATSSARAIVGSWLGESGYVVEDVSVDASRPAAADVRFIDLNGDRFAAGSSVVPVDPVALDRAVAALTADPSITAVVNGHGDVVGEQSDTLALERARAAVEYLAARGVDRSRLSVAASADLTGSMLDTAVLGRVDVTLREPTA